MQKGNSDDLSDVDIAVIVVVLLVVATILSLALSLPRIADSPTDRANCKKINPRR